MKICFLTKTLNIDSGWGRYSWGIINQISKEKNVEVIVLTEESSDYIFAKAVLKNSFKNLFFIFSNAFTIRKHLKDCQVIHCLDGYPYGIIGALANIGLNKKLIISGVGTYSVAPLIHLIKGWLLKMAYKKASAVPCISSYTEKQILEKVKLKNTQVVHMGIDFDKFQGISRKLSSQKVILSVGALKRRKGYHISIPAIGKVKKKYPNLKYYIVGDQGISGYFDELKQLVKENNLERNMIFLEKISDKELIKLYYQANLFVLTSVNIGYHFEGFGLVYLEANATGLPVIGTRNCGAEDAIKSGFNGFLVPQNDISTTEQAILKILDNSELAKQIGDNGMEFAKSMSWGKTIKKYIEIYKNNA